MNFEAIFIKELKKIFTIINTYLKHKDENNITNIEKELSNYNSKTCDVKKFEDYIKNKNRINNLLFGKYNDEIFRKYKWYGFLNKKHADGKLIKEIKEVFGEETIIFYGDALINDTCKRGNISVPGRRYEKLIKANFKTYKLDEFRTSKLYYKTETLVKIYM